MAGFLRKFRKTADVEHPAPSKPVVQYDSPPSLPPLFARFATSTLESSLLESCIMPVAKPQVEDEWDPWKALVPNEPTPLPPKQPPSQPPPQPVVRVQPPPLPPTRRKYTGPGLPPQVKLADPIRVTPTPPSKHPPQLTPPKPGSSSSSSSNHTDATRFTRSASSSSAFTSTSSIAPAIKHLDVTRPQGRSPSTSAQQQRLAASPINSLSPPSRSTNVISQPAISAIGTARTQTQTRLLSAVTAPPRSPVLAEQNPKRNLMTTTVMTQTATRSSTARSPVVPPSSSTARSSVISSSTATPARSSSTTRSPNTAPHRAPTSTRSAAAPPPTTYAIPPRQNTQPLQLNLNRSTSIELSDAPIRKGPLIFAAMAIGQGQVAPIAQQENLSPNQNPNPGALSNQRTSNQNALTASQRQNALATSQRQQAPVMFNQRQQAPTPISQHDNSVNTTTYISASSARRVADHRTLGYPSPPVEYSSLDLVGARGVNVPLASSERPPVPTSTSVPFTSERVGLIRGGSERITQGQGQGRVAASGSGPFTPEIGAGRRISLDVGSGRSSDALTGRPFDIGPLPSRLRVSSDASTRMAPPTPMRKLDRVTSKESLKPRVLTKSRPPTPSGPSPSSVPAKLLPKKTSMEVFSEDALFLDEDPFKKVEGVRVVKMCGNEEGAPRPATPSRPKSPLLARPKSPLIPESPEDYLSARTQRRGQWLEKTRPPVVTDAIAQQEVMSKEAELLQEEEDTRLKQVEEARQKEEEVRQKEENERLEKEAEEKRLRDEAEELARKPPSFYPIVSHLADTSLLPHLLAYLTFGDWCALYATNKEVRAVFENRALREYVLEHFLGTVGYKRWSFEWAEPLALSLKDLNDYMRGVSMPTHQYAQQAEAYLQPRIPKSSTPGECSKVVVPDILSLAMTTRAYTRVVMRLRAQAESDARVFARSHVGPVSKPATQDGQVVRSSSSRTPSPTSLYSHGKSSSVSNSAGGFQSPLVRLHRAPLLRVFVPSPEGEWLSDSSVVECEAELKRAGVLKLLRVGDVVWDVAVGDEGNLGRMVWDGSYLVDLDYKYSRMGELSPYFHSLAFSPSYFHRVIRTGVNAVLNPGGNPIVYLDLSPWGQELAANLQLLQDRAMTATPHGTLHSVVHWLHRSSFTIRPPVSPHHPHAYSHSQNLRLPIPNVAGFFIDPGWYGTVIVEAEGTNEGLADFQARCGPGAFPPRADNVTSKMRSEKEKGSRRVYRVLREKSRPGEIWIRAVREKERVM